VGPGDSASSDFQVFSWIFGTASPHVSPHGAIFAGGVGLRRRSGSEGVGIGWSGGEERLCPALALRGVARGEPVLPYDLRALGPKQRRGSVPERGGGGSIPGLVPAPLAAEGKMVFGEASLPTGSEPPLTGAKPASDRPQPMPQKQPGSGRRTPKGRQVPFGRAAAKKIQGVACR